MFMAWKQRPGDIFVKKYIALYNVYTNAQKSGVDKSLFLPPIKKCQIL